MVVFGGLEGSSIRGDVWALLLAGSPTWSKLTPSGNPPSPRYGHTAIYDPVRDRVLVFGGFDGFNFLNDASAFSLAGSPAWISFSPTGNPPSGRLWHTAIYDPVRDRMVMFGGNGGNFRNDVWALSLAGSPVWSALAPAGGPPSGRDGHAAIYDPLRDRMVAFGGYDGLSRRNDAWVLSLAASPAWSALISIASPPAARSLHTAIYDPVRDRMVVFGGYDGTVLFDDVWALSLAGNSAWSELAPTGSPPSGRLWHTAIYDPVRDRMLIFGGVDAGNVRNDTWALSLAGSPAWSVLAPAGNPPPGRYAQSAIYDPVRDKMVVFAGSDGSLRNDVWALSLAESPQWSEVFPAGGPPSARLNHKAIYDPVRDRMVVFGGYDGSRRNDAWALSLAGGMTWSALAPAGSPPSGRDGHTAIYDPVRDRMVVFGGYDGTTYPNDVPALSLPGNPAWSTLAPAGSPPSRLYDHTAIYDPVRDRMVLFGGNAGVNLNDVWALWWGVAVSVPGDADALPPRFELLPPQPNPSRGETAMEFELAQPARVVLDVFDTNGRLIQRIADEWFTAGRHVSTWRGVDDRGLAVGSGVYFIRMETGGFHATRRMVRVR
jgi:hypothetical protein